MMQSVIKYPFHHRFLLGLSTAKRPLGFKQPPHRSVMGASFSLSCLRLWNQRNKKPFSFSWLPATILLQSYPPSIAHPQKKGCNALASLVLLYPPYDCENPQVPLWPVPYTARYPMINVWHPGYPDQQNLLFSLPLLDRVVATGKTKKQEGTGEGGFVREGGGGREVMGEKVGERKEKEQEKPLEELGQEQEAVGVVGIHYGTLITACSIVTGNSTDGFLTHDREGKDHLVDCADNNWDRVLVDVTSCYFHLNRPSSTPYPVCPSFAHWNFPHKTFPRKWLVVSASPPHLSSELPQPDTPGQLFRTLQGADEHVPLALPQPPP